MLENMSSNNIFEYKKLSKEEQEKRGILGRLVGVMADSINPTRNGRKYSAELWQKVFENPIMKEKIENRVCFGEACHPTDGREEVDPEKVAICLAEVPKMNNKGQLIGIFDVLDTPCGRILKTMLDYGANIGVSSRGSGDVETDFLGEESVNPDTYDCICWDAVFVPAVKEARLKLVTESLEGKTLRQALAESIEAANEEEKVIMKETLDNFDIRLTEDVKQDESLDNINDEDSEELAVDDIKAEFEELQEALKENNELANTITSLQEKLSVSYAKEAELQEEVNKYSKSIRRLSNEARQVSSLKAKVSSLNEELNSIQDQLNKKDVALKQARNNSLKVFENNKVLNEKYSTEQSQVTKLSHKLSSLTESYENEKKQLNENIADLKNTIEIKNKEYSQKLQKSNTLVEKYKKIASKAVDKYIDSQALMLGITKNEIKNRLSESYSFDEIDAVCEDLKEYKLNISKLPFRTTNLNENIQMKITPSKNETILPANSFGDEVDEQLMNLAGLK